MEGSVQEGRLAIAATFVAEPVEAALRFWLDALALDRTIEFAPFDQVFQQLLDPGSLFGRNTGGTNVVLLRIEDVLPAPVDGRSDATSDGRLVDDLVAAVTASVARGVAHLLIVCPPSPRAVADPVRRLALQRVEQAVADRLGSQSGVQVVTSAYLQTTYPVEDADDAHGDGIGRIPYTMPAYTALATVIARMLHAPRNLSRKLVVLDADETLWTGVCGEDGPHGVRVDRERIALQQFMLEQQQAGLLLALCSANNESDVAAVFDQRTDMPLARADFAGWRVDWRPKSENIAAIARELGIGLDSVVFIDDDDAVCAEVRAHCPEVLTIQLPRARASIPRFLRHLWVFDRFRVTREAGLRTASYRDQARREQVRQASPSLSDFIASLELRCTVSAMAPADISRVSELTHRTNQFNLTTLRRSETDIQALVGDDAVECLVVRVADRFGDYGLVGTLILQRHPDALAITTFLLSCRALGRGVEFEMLAAVARRSLALGLQWVDLVFVETAKNRPARDFLDALMSAADAGAGALEAEGADPDRVRSAPARRIRLSAAAASAAVRPARAGSTRSAPVAARPVEGNGDAAVAEGLSYESIATDLVDVDRIHQAVLARSHRRNDLSTPYVAPRTRLEADLAAIWSDLFGIDQIGVDDNFFDLDGHSLLAMQMLSRIRETIGVELSVRTLFSDQFTIASVAVLVLEEQVRSGGHADVDQLIDEIDRLTDDEVSALLDAEKP